MLERSRVGIETEREQNLWFNEFSTQTNELFEKIKRESDDPEQGELADQNMTEGESNGSDEVSPNTADQHGLPGGKGPTETPESQTEPTDPWAR